MVAAAGTIDPDQYEFERHGAGSAVSVGDGKAAVSFEPGCDAVLPAIAIDALEPHLFAPHDPQLFDGHNPTRACRRRMPLSQRS